MKCTTTFFVLGLLSVGCTSSSKTKEVSETMRQEKYTEDWSSLKHHQTPDWFRDAKFGIYFHWGPYSVPAYENEWYSHWMYVDKNHPEYPYNKKFNEHHVATYGPLDQFGYKDFIPMFRAEKFDPKAWASLFKKAGARFAGPVAEHADGFAMWDSQLTEWDAVDKGPKRDIVGELEKAIRAEGLKFITTYHRHWLFGWFPTWDTSLDAGQPEFSGLYGPKVNKGDFIYPYDPNGNKPRPDYYPMGDFNFNQQWTNRLKELIDNYHPDLIWLDNKVDVIDESYRKKFLAYYYNEAQKRNQEVAVTYKFEDFAQGSAILDVERARMSEKKSFPWLTDDSVDWKSWSHIKNPDYKSTNRLIDVLVDIVSKNGCLLLNITPRADGTIPEPVQERLLEIGSWLDQNGEAIYDTRPWTIYGEGPTQVQEGHLSEQQNEDNTARDIRFTQKGDVLYAIALDWPKNNELQIHSLGLDKNLLQTKITAIELIGHSEKLQWEQTAGYLSVRLPEKSLGNYAYAFRIQSE